MDRRQQLVLAVVLVLAGSYVVADSLGPSPADESAAAPTVEDSRLIQPTDNGSYLWPYTSRTKSISGRALAINVIIHGPPDKTRTALTDTSNLDWQPVNESEEDTNPELGEADDSGVDWDDAAGSTRYSYISRGPNGGSGKWVDVSYQLNSGTYLGSRHHIRAYSSPGDNWTAVQVHREYFDWFRLRHTVTDIHGASRLLEDDFIDQPFVEEVSRNHYGLQDGWSDGWITGIELAIVTMLSTVLARDTRRAIVRVGRDLGRWTVTNRHGFLLAGALAGLLLGVRAAGIALESAFPGQSPQLFAGLLYPLIVFGPPTLVALLAPRLRPQGAFGFTVAGFGAGLVYDFTAIGLGVVPVELVLHRVGLAITLGMLAVAVIDSHNTGRFGKAGSVDEPDPPIIVIVGLAWLVGLGLPLFGYF